MPDTEINPESPIKFFITILELYGASASDYDVLYQRMEREKFFRQIEGNDGKLYSLPSYVYRSQGSLTADQIRIIATNIALLSGKPFSVMTFSWMDASWTLRGAPERLLNVINETTEKLKPISADGMKMTSDFGQLLLKTCITLNGGALIAFPAFYKALAPSNAASVSPDFEAACQMFGVGTCIAGVGCVVAFAVVASSTRMSIRALQLPMLQAQVALLPETAEITLKKNLKRSRFAAKWLPTLSAWGIIICAILGVVSITAFLSGSIYGRLSIVELLHPQPTQIAPPSVSPPKLPTLTQPTP
jgi:hypothetical protein